MTSWDASRGHRGRATLGGDARWQSLVRRDNRFAAAQDKLVRLFLSLKKLTLSFFPVDGGMLVGVQPTGRTFEVQQIHMYRVLDGKIAEHFANRDDIRMIRQLGLLPPPPSLPGQ
jgi:hypothetical protein